MRDECFDLAHDLNRFMTEANSIAKLSAALLAKYQCRSGNQQTVEAIGRLKKNALFVYHQIKKEWKLIEGLAQDKNKREFEKVVVK